MSKKLQAGSNKETGTREEDQDEGPFIINLPCSRFTLFASVVFKDGEQQELAGGGGEGHGTESAILAIGGREGYRRGTRAYKKSPSGSTTTENSGELR
ncbi:hypothetical protein VTO42DRAFT_8722 [Malbranchea cinnamomea]